MSKWKHSLRLVLRMQQSTSAIACSSVHERSWAAGSQEMQGKRAVQHPGSQSCSHLRAIAMACRRWLCAAACRLARMYSWKVSLVPARGAKMSSCRKPDCTSAPSAWRLCAQQDKSQRYADDVLWGRSFWVVACLGSFESCLAVSCQAAPLTLTRMPQHSLLA